MHWWLMFEIVIEAYRWFFLRLADVVGLGWGIVALSFITSAAMMPLMKLVAGVVRREAEYQSVILPQLADIKSRYSSDAERHVHVQRLYRRYGYSPLSAVKKVLPLFVQIPFLLLTYFMLKDTAELQGVSFLFLRDLGKPDGLLRVLDVNLLPIAMTLVNLLTVVATPGFTRKDNVQAVSISLLFLLLLYTAPSALLLYWTLNNIITMLRTLYAKRGEGGRLLLSRIKMLQCVPSMLRRVIATKMLACFSLSLFVLTLYFCGTAKLMMEVNGGIVCNVMYRGMTFVLAAASIVQFIHLRKDAYARKLILYVSVIACLGFAVVLSGMFVFSRMMFMSFLGWVDMFVAVACLSVLWMLPYGFMKGNSIVDAVKEWYRALIYSGWMFIFPVIIAIHYSYASEVFVLNILELLTLCVYMIVPCIVTSFALIVLFRRWIAGNSLFKFSVGVFVGIYLIPLITTETGWFAYNRNLLIRIVLIGATSVMFILVKRRTKGLVFSAFLMSAVIVSAVINHGKDIVAQPVSNDSSWRDRMESVIGDAHCVRSNNVYLLVYDAYGHRSILDGLGLQDDAIYEKLKSYGYTLYDAYSVGADTLTSMAAMFTFNNIKGDGDQATVSGDNVFCDLLRTSGYKTSYILLGYLIPAKDRRKPGDYYFPGESKITRPEMVLYPCILRGSLSQSPSVFDSYSMDEWLKEKYNALDKCPNTHSFVYAHMEYPAHAPWHPRYRKTDKEEQVMYGDRLKKANEQMVKDLERLDKDPDSIVILMSDHGGSLIIPENSGECGIKNLIDHVGVFLAIRWPRDYVPTLELNCIQNVLVEVMIYLTGDKSLKRLEVPGVTVSLDYPFGTAAGVINKGVIQFGEGAGENLFDAAWRVFGSSEKE